MDNKARMKELVNQLKAAAKAYYAEDREIISNLEYDQLYDELVLLEKNTGIVFTDSPTVTVGYESVEELPKERHEKPMLSLSKTKSREELKDWLGGHPALLSWKLDGLTVVLTYKNGKLDKAVTRGNGEIGEVITNNAKTFINIPLQIAYKGELVIRGEAVISYSDFERINTEIEEVDAKYKNPRNLCSGSVRQLNNAVTASRNVRLYVFALVKADGIDFHNKRSEEFLFLANQGFDVVEEVKVSEDNILETITYFEQKIETFDIPSDGLVLTYEEIEYGDSLGMTSKFPRNAIAFKWQDETAETILRDIIWSPSRTGLINPIAAFEPVQLEGTTVSRASVHNISVMHSLKLGIGDKIKVYKANMIIPQIAENLTGSDSVTIPEKCPACEGKTELRKLNNAVSLYCTNEECPARKIKLFTHFVSRDALNIDGLSEATLEKFIGRGFIHQFSDIFHLQDHSNEIIEMDSFGQKSYDNLMQSIEKARHTSLPRLLYALGISNIGLSNAKMICRYYKNDCDALLEADEDELSKIDGVGGVIAHSFRDYFESGIRIKQFQMLLEELEIEKVQYNEAQQSLSGMSFVITGSLEHYENRDTLKAVIESLGGKVTGSVTGKTECLINNDITSNSSKNKKAKQLGISIMTEDSFIEKYHLESTVQK